MVVASMSKPETKDNLGSQVLRALSEPHGMQKIIAELSGVSQTWLSRLADGAKPGRSNSRSLERSVGIDQDWWDQSPVSRGQLFKLLATLPPIAKNTGT